MIQLQCGVSYLNILSIKTKIICLIFELFVILH